MSAPMFSPARPRFFGLAPESAPAAPGHLNRLASSRSTAAPASCRLNASLLESGATSAFGPQDVLPRLAQPGATIGRQDAGAAKAKLPAAPRWQSKELRWLVAFLPEQQRDDLIFCLGETLRWRARECGPLPPPKKAVERVRFGLIGEQLWEIGFDTLRNRLRAELREAIRALEGEQPRLVRNLWLAMHSIRLGQLYQELLSREEDALEEARSGLIALWA